VVLLSVLSYPLAVLAMLAGHVQPDLVRYVIIVPCVMLGMTVLTTGQMRERAAAEQEVLRRRAAEADLRRLNDSLELRVAARTAELRNMVAGLESFNRSVSHDLRGPLGGMAQACSWRAGAGPGPATTRCGTSWRWWASRPTVGRPGERAAGAGARGQRRAAPAAVAAGSGGGRVAGAAARQHGDSAVDRPARRHGAPLPAVTADPGLLRQVFVNLLGNALKFTRDAAAPQVEVGMRPDAAGTDRAVTVRDNGVGFDPAVCRAAVPALPAPARRAVPGLGRGAVDREAHHRPPWRAAVGRVDTRRGFATFCFTLGPGTYLKLRLRVARARASSTRWTRVRSAPAVRAPPGGAPRPRIARCRRR
jgi:hypothetical protein